MASAEPVIRTALDRLQTVPALDALSSNARDALARVGSISRFRPGNEILRQGDLPRAVFLILSGRVKMCRHLASGRTVILSLFAPGDLFGTAAIASQISRDTMVALDPTDCLEIRRRDLFTLLESQPDLIVELIPFFTRQLVECNNCMVEMTGSRVDARLARLFLKLADDVGRSEDRGTFVPVHLSRQELADLTGTTVETCIRIMSPWDKSGVVETREQGFVIRDRALLEEIAGG
jgi:CRP/FNR family transcriptional regulator